MFWTLKLIIESSMELGCVRQLRRSGSGLISSFEEEFGCRRRRRSQGQQAAGQMTRSTSLSDKSPQTFHVSSTSHVTRSINVYFRN